MTNEDEKVAVENETPEATQETEAPVETPAEEPVMAGEAAHKDAKDMKKEAMHDKKKDMKKEAMHGKDKKKMDEYKIQKSADNSDKADSKSSPVNSKVKSMGGGTHNIAKGGAEEKGRPAPTASKMSGDFENSPAKDKSSSFKKNEFRSPNGDYTIYVSEISDNNDFLGIIIKDMQSSDITITYTAKVARIIDVEDQIILEMENGKIYSENLNLSEVFQVFKHFEHSVWYILFNH